MRVRLIAFLPLATLISVLLLSSASSFVSAIERAWIPDSSDLLPIMRIRQFETKCDQLFREIHALSHETPRCDESRECLGSPLLCPSTMDAEIDREFQRLRSVLNERCGLPLRLMDYAWGGGGDVEGSALENRHEAWTGGVGGSSGEGCGPPHDWLEAATSGHVEPTRFLF